MMEEVMSAPASVPAVAEPRPQLVAGGRPRAIVPTDIDQVWRIAQMVHKSGLAPRDLETSEKISIAILHGSEIGLPPMTSLQRIAVINGRPAVWGDAVPGIALSTGLVEDWYEAITGDGDNMVAMCRVKRKGIKTAAERTFSVTDAKRANLWDTRARVTRRKRDGSTYETANDSPWYRYPKRMLQMRARVAFRDLFADALGGLYIAEELDTPPAEMKDVTPPRAAKGQAQQPAPTATPVEDAGYRKVDDGEYVEIETSPVEPEASASKRPLPPLARGARAADEDIPVFLQRQAPPADQPEPFREWIIAKVGMIKTTDELQISWDTYVQPNVDNEQILPPDLDDLAHIFATRRKELEAQ
jgi:hypothetical protein